MNAFRKQMTAADYIRANFDSSDRLAVLARNRQRSETLQRISTAARIADPQFQDWLRYKNVHDGFDIYLNMNPLKSETPTRTKQDIQVIKHLYVDLNHDGAKSLAAIQHSHLVPPPSCVLSTSPDGFQAIWRVEGVTPEDGEALLHALARQFNGDPAAADLATTLYLPGFANNKHEEDFQVTVCDHTGRIYQPQEFRLRAEPVNSGLARWSSSSENRIAPIPRVLSQKERDSAYAKGALTRGFPPEEVIRDIAEFRAQENPRAEDYARRTVTTAQAELNAQVSTEGAGKAGI
jgi:hypothetical protein